VKRELPAHEAPGRREQVADLMERERRVSPMLYGISATDPFTYGGVSLFLVLVWRDVLPASIRFPH